MTNGEKMRAVFPDIKMWGESKDTLDYSLGGMIHRVMKNWWNAGYKEPSNSGTPNRWIPVSKKMPDEKLPENFRRVLITVVNYAGDKVVRVAIYINLRRQFRVEGSSNIWEIGEKGLLAWMPLPDPYAENKAGTKIK